jgi:hypothetical protein
VSTGTLSAAISGCALTLAVGVLHTHERSVTGAAGGPEPHLYVRSAAVASRLVLSFDAVASDFYWIRAIQHYGRERRSPRGTAGFPLLEPLVELTTSLDPQFNLAYRFGAILLALDPPNGPARPDQAIRLLEKGLAANPGRWQYAHDIGFVHYFHTGKFTEAAGWFKRAAEMPGAPRWLGPLSAMTLARGGDRTGARQLLLHAAEASDDYIRRSAERGLAQLQVLDDIDHWRTKLREHTERFGVRPGRLQDVARGFPARLQDPSGHPYVYDPGSGNVTLAPDSPLWPLPRTLGQ